MSNCFVYVIECRSTRPYPVKIGVASNPSKRVIELQTGCPYRLRVIASIPFPTRAAAYDFEQFVHSGNKKAAIGGEWFKSKRLDLNRSIRAWNSFCDSKIIATKDDEKENSQFGRKRDSEVDSLRRANKKLKEENTNLKRDIDEYLDSQADLSI